VKGKEVLFSKKSDHWETPQEIKDLYKDYFDPCPLHHNIKEWDGLKIKWKSYTYVNPPYSNIRAWLEKAEEELKEVNCLKIVFLVPARTDTKWFHEIAKNYEIRFIKGRLKFSNSKHSAPFPSMFIIMRK